MIISDVIGGGGAKVNEPEISMPEFYRASVELVVKFWYGVVVWFVWLLTGGGAVPLVEFVVFVPFIGGGAVPLVELVPLMVPLSTSGGEVELVVLVELIGGGYSGLEELVELFGLYSTGGASVSVVLLLLLVELSWQWAAWTIKTRIKIMLIPLGTDIFSPQ